MHLCNEIFFEQLKSCSPCSSPPRFVMLELDTDCEVDPVIDNIVGLGS